jgi:hypothetical protein
VVSFDEVVVQRREFITLFGGIVAASPLTAQAQLAERKRSAVLMTLTANDRRAQSFVAAFTERLRLLGWKDGFNAPDGRPVMQIAFGHTWPNWLRMRQM